MCEHAREVQLLLLIPDSGTWLFQQHLVKVGKGRGCHRFVHVRH